MGTGALNAREVSNTQTALQSCTAAEIARRYRESVTEPDDRALARAISSRRILWKAGPTAPEVSTATGAKSTPVSSEYFLSFRSSAMMAVAFGLTAAALVKPEA